MPVVYETLKHKNNILTRFDKNVYLTNNVTEDHSNRSLDSEIKILILCQIQTNTHRQHFIFFEAIETFNRSNPTGIKILAGKTLSRIIFTP